MLSPVSGDLFECEAADANPPPAASYTILLRHRYIPPAIKAGAIVKQTICMRNPSCFHWFSQLIMRPAYPMTSSITPAHMAKVNAVARRVNAYVKTNPRNEMLKRARKGRICTDRYTVKIIGCRYGTGINCAFRKAIDFVSREKWEKGAHGGDILRIEISIYFVSIN
ncbi:hypothetical protein EYC84_008507 [Monilinia fructicola]|uniref:Uncharacterized protein n=1 Tax=Monilinia fructicola TaxID=38448 RepID=A0A5M9JFK9_MONFR|nr:hypothetical protein EYC84_008507 [Monilinia fructicola]